jgi:nondiscriminating aspartyl-tRNA synthetase
MERSLVRELAGLVGGEVKLQGWIYTIRDQKRMQFIVLRDHTGMTQVVLEKNEANAALNARVTALSRESVVTLHGEVVANAQVKLGGLEVRLQSLDVESEAQTPLPLDITGGTDPNLDLRLDWRFLDLRRPENLLIFKVQTTVLAAMRDFCTRESFVEINSPKLLGAASESGAEVFRLEYFGRYAYLAQSPQFYKQMAMAAGFDRVLEVGPVFRAEPSFTSRHATEFTGVDVEISWITSHDDVMCFEERWLQYVLQVVQEKHGDEIARVYHVAVQVPSLPFPRVPMRDALALLAKKGYTPAPERNGDLDPQGERLMGEYAQQEYGHEFVFVTDYPIGVRPFYHMRYAQDPGTTKSFDLLWKGLEITTGAQREHRYDVLVKQALEKGLSQEGIQFYLDFFRYGCPPHGGLGLGLSRTLMALLGVANMREVTYLFRGPTRLAP